MKTCRCIPLAGAICLALFAASTHAEDYVAYSVTDKGKAPLPEQLDGIDAKYLLNVEWGDYSGRKTRLGVLEVNNTSAAGSYSFAGPLGAYDYSPDAGTVPVNGIEAIVIDSLNQTGRFRLVERTELGSVLDEQDLAASGRISAPSGAKTGNVLGAELLVQVVVTDYEQDTSGKGGGLGALIGGSVPVLGGVKIDSSQGRVGLNVRLIDAETSEIVFSKQIESIIKESGLTVGLGGQKGDVNLGGFYDQYSKTPIGQAVIAGVNQGTYELIKQTGAQVADGSVVKADANQIYLNLGSDSVAAGDTLLVVEMGEELIDPETGISLGGFETVLGEIVVNQVNDKFSIATPVTLSKIPARGDKVVATKEAEPMTFASSWSPPR